MTGLKNPLFTTSEAGQHVCPAVTRQTIMRWIEVGLGGHRLAAHRLGRYYGVRTADLVGFCDRTGRVFIP